jgi:hypothetical protein
MLFLSTTPLLDISGDQNIRSDYDYRWIRILRTAYSFTWRMIIVEGCPPSKKAMKKFSNTFPLSENYCEKYEEQHQQRRIMSRSRITNEKC